MATTAMGWRSGQSYSQDLRDRVLGAVGGGIAARAAATTFKVSIACIYKALIRRRLIGDVRINPNCGHAPRVAEQDRSGVAAQAVESSDSPLSRTP